MPCWRKHFNVEKLWLFLFMCVCISLHVPYVFRCQWTISGVRYSGTGVAGMKHLMWVLRTDLSSSGRAVRILNPWNIFSAPEAIFNPLHSPMSYRCLPSRVRDRLINSSWLMKSTHSCKAASDQVCTWAGQTQNASYSAQPGENSDIRASLLLKTLLCNSDHVQAGMVSRTWDPPKQMWSVVPLIRISPYNVSLPV